MDTTKLNDRFESFVNSDRCKAVTTSQQMIQCLRALLIQIGVKPYRSRGNPELSLRALCLCSDRDTGIVLIFFKISRLIL